MFSTANMSWAVCLYCCPDCRVCVNQIFQATLAIWAAVKKYNRNITVITCNSFYQLLYNIKVMVINILDVTLLWVVYDMTGKWEDLSS